MKKHYEFHITDRQGTLYHVTAIEFETRRGGTALMLNLRPLRCCNVIPLMYVRYPISSPGTGSVYWEFDFWSCKAIERVSIRKYFPSWDMRKIRKEWRCLNG